MNPNEFRIGNWVMYDNRYFQLHVIAEEMPSLNTDEFGIGVVSWKSIQPIALTPEILDKCGFESRFSKKEYFILCPKGTKSDGLFLEISFTDYSCSIGQLNYFSHQFGEYKYLNQLQNLYFALTSKELVCKFKNS